MSDLIRRQDAVNALDKRFDDVPMELTTEILLLRKDLREVIPSAQPVTISDTADYLKLQKNNDNDLISRQAAMDAIAKMMPKSYTPDGSHPADEEIFRAQEIFADCIKTIERLPSAQPEIIRCHQCGFWDRETLRHQHNDFRDWNEAECMVLAERDGYNEISHYVEADDYCSYAERKTNE